MVEKSVKEEDALPPLRKVYIFVSFLSKLLLSFMPWKRNEALLELPPRVDPRGCFGSRHPLELLQDLDGAVACPSLPSPSCGPAEVDRLCGMRRPPSFHTSSFRALKLLLSSFECFILPLKSLHGLPPRHWVHPDGVLRADYHQANTEKPVCSLHSLRAFTNPPSLSLPPSLPPSHRCTKE